jgi:hypothetical protein
VERLGIATHDIAVVSPNRRPRRRVVRTAGTLAALLLAGCMSPSMPTMPQSAAPGFTPVPSSASGQRAASPECEQIAMQLMPYVQQMRPGITALNDTSATLRARGEARMAADLPVATAAAAAQSVAGALPIGGNAAGGAIGMAEAAREQAQRRAWVAEDRPLTEQMNAQGAQTVSQAQQMQTDPHFQQLMQAGADHHCF